MYLEYLPSHWAGVRAGLIETLDKFRDEELDFKPFPASWSVRQLMLHIAQEENGELNYGITQTLAGFPPDYDPQDYATVASIRALLASVHSSTLAYLETLTEADLNRVIVTPWGPSYPLIEMLGHILDHEIHHRAELSLILGMLGREGLNA
ncbi:MAG: DinB family protein [Anaerolineales bacterium]